MEFIRVESIHFGFATQTYLKIKVVRKAIYSR